MSNSVRPHRRQPNRLPGPWDSPGKNTGVGCHFLLQVSGKESTCQWRKKWQPTPVFLPGKFHGQRSLADYNPWGHKRVRHNLANKQQYTIENNSEMCNRIYFGALKNLMLLI